MNMQEQIIITTYADYAKIGAYMKKKEIDSVMLVCNTSINYLKIKKYFETLEKNKEIKFIKFNDFKPNPSYESIVKGVEILNREECKMIIAVGGGSAIDVAK